MQLAETSDIIIFQTVCGRYTLGDKPIISDPQSSLESVRDVLQKIAAEVENSLESALHHTVHSAVQAAYEVHYLATARRIAAEHLDAEEVLPALVLLPAIFFLQDRELLGVRQQSTVVKRALIQRDVRWMEFLLWKNRKHDPKMRTHPEPTLMTWHEWQIHKPTDCSRPLYIDDPEPQTRRNPVWIHLAPVPPRKRGRFYVGRISLQLHTSSAIKLLLQTKSSNYLFHTKKNEGMLFSIIPEKGKTPSIFPHLFEEARQEENALLVALEMKHRKYMTVNENKGFFALIRTVLDIQSSHKREEDASDLNTSNKVVSDLRRRFITKYKKATEGNSKELVSLGSIHRIRKYIKSTCWKAMGPKFQSDVQEEKGLSTGGLDLENRAALQEAISRFSELQFEVYSSSFVDKRSEEEIAQKLGLTPAQVKKHLQEAEEIVRDIRSS